MIYFSIYSDASISISGVVRTSWIIKIDRNVVSSGCETAPHKLPSGHSTAAELYAIYIAICKLKHFLAARPQYRLLLRFAFYTDSQSAVIGLNCVKSRCKDYAQVYNIINQQISTLPGPVEFSWIKRNSNYEADKLSNSGRLKKVGESSRSQIVSMPTKIPGRFTARSNYAYRDRLRKRSS